MEETTVKYNLDKRDELIDQLMTEDDLEKSKEMINLFNINIAKKNTLRVAKVDELLDKVNDEALKRVTERPDEINDKDLLSYMTAAQNQIDKSMNTINSINEVPAINLTQDNSVNININQPELTKESRDRILNAVKQFMEASNQPEVIEAKIKKK